MRDAAPLLTGRRRFARTREIGTVRDGDAEANRCSDAFSR
ncbi:hypothetical protein SAMN05443575_2972 [Jatrophihabitans endophyticus]|uniref:Uncharacterized protein n=1 Tax=Jatrophihabitans endophyticus TaxID=1206085 RepID=A0A1M5P5R3_9ACTN|nr:hypothetical protein SAMN05443575_2972 [Jatrophihabitans endophyticus]